MFEQNSEYAAIFMPWGQIDKCVSGYCPSFANQLFEPANFAGLEMHVGWVGGVRIGEREKERQRGRAVCLLDNLTASDADQIAVALNEACAQPGIDPLDQELSNVCHRWEASGRCRVDFQIEEDNLPEPLISHHVPLDCSARVFS
jgi:hypothetical protein